MLYHPLSHHASCNVRFAQLKGARLIVSRARPWRGMSDNVDARSSFVLEASFSVQVMYYIGNDWLIATHCIRYTCSLFHVLDAVIHKLIDCISRGRWDDKFPVVSESIFWMAP